MAKIIKKIIIQSNIRANLIYFKTTDIRNTRKSSFIFGNQISI